MLRIAGLLVISLAVVSGAASAETGFTVALQPVRDPKPVFATVESRNVVPARARLGGTVAYLTVEEGDIVTAGQVIATVGDEKLASQFAVLKAEADRAEADLQRARDLAARGVIPKAELDAAEAAAATARSRLDAQRQLMAEGAILSPRAGRVLSVPVTSGTVVFPGEPVATIAEEDYVLRLRLPERHARFLKAGDKVSLPAVIAGASPVTGTIRLVYPQIEDGRVVADAMVEGLEKYFVGERVRVLIYSEERQAIVIPAAFVRTKFGVDYVDVRAGDAAVEAPVQPGQATAMPDGTAGVEILSGLVVGDVLVSP